MPALFVLATYALEVQQPEIGLKIGNILFGVVCVGIVALGLLSRLGSQPLLFAPPNIFDFCFVLYVGWCLASFKWAGSVNALIHPLIIGLSWLATKIVGRFRLEDSIRFLVVSCVVASLISIALRFISPHIALQPFSSSGAPELRGIFDHQLRLGLLTGTAFGLLVLGFLNGDMRRMRGNIPAWAWWAFTAIILVTCYLARARLFTAALIVALPVCGLIAGRLLTRTGSAVVLIAGFFIWAYDSQSIIDAVFKTKSDITLSGRTTVWQRALAAASERPIRGSGFATFNDQRFDYLWAEYRPPSAHNTFIHAYFETGLVGLGFLVASLVSALCIGMYLSVRLRKVSYTLFMTVYGVFCGLFSVVFAGKASIFISIFVLILAQELSMLRRQQQRAPAPAPVPRPAVPRGSGPVPTS